MEGGRLGLAELGLHEAGLLVGGPNALVDREQPGVRVAGQAAGPAVALLGLAARGKEGT